MELEQLLKEIKEDGLTEAVLSNSTKKEILEKVKIRPVSLGDELYWQVTSFRNNQVFHENCSLDETFAKIADWIGTTFRQAQLTSVHFRGIVLVGKKGTMTVKKKQIAAGEKEAGESGIRTESHNREKNYILKEGAPIDFLVELSVMSKDGRVFKNRYDKFRQINRFLEFIADVLPALPTDRPVRIIDFGCGKSYLTFAMYYYLHELKGMELEVIGLDLKKDVIAHCSELAERLGYRGLHFAIGDIAGYQDNQGADMVVTLHACDTATDYALARAVA